MFYVAHNVVKVCQTACMQSEQLRPEQPQPEQPQSELPHWQLTSIFSALDGDDYIEAKTQLELELSELERFLSEHDVRSGEGLELSPELVDLYKTLDERFNALIDDIVTMRVYLTGFVAVDAFNETAQAQMSQARTFWSQFITLYNLYTAWLGRLDMDALREKSDYARAHSFALHKSAIEAKHLMSDEAEALASSLNTSGGAAWVKLHDDLTSRISIRADLGAHGDKDFGLAELKNLSHDPDEQVRRNAQKAELELLSRNELAYAAAMNGVKGEVNTLVHKRGWDSALTATLLDSSISSAALDAMQSACEDSFSYFRRYLKAKARFLGEDTLGEDTLQWHNRFAPVSVDAPRTFSWQAAKDFVVEAFASYSDELAQYAQKTFEQGWLDVPPRPGKRSGAFCAPVPGRQESRIMLNFGGTLDDVFTLAHELGHGYHNEQMYRAGRDAIQRETPMTLAETASIFCETIVVNRMLAKASEAEQLAILEQDLLGATQLVVDIHSRFLFEDEVFKKRLERELSVDELKTIMLDAQAQTYGDAVADYHPLMWAQKGHYYSTGRSYYNFPYTFGYLFGLGIYATYKAEPQDFQAKYNDLLSSTGMADARTLGKRFGIDIEDKRFWESSLDVAKKRIEAYEALVERYSSAAVS